MGFGMEGRREMVIANCHPVKALKYPKKSKCGRLNPNWKGGKVRKVCARCKRIFFVIPSRRESAAYCTLECFNALQREARIDWWRTRNPEKVRPPPVIKGTRLVAYDVRICLWCKSTFESRPSIMRRICSPECHVMWTKWRSSGHMNPGWKGGKCHEPYPFNWREISDSILRRDGRKCQNPKCEMRHLKVDAHHIDYDKSNCSEKNLIALCSKCHTTTNFNRLHWLEYYRSIQTARGIQGTIGITPRMQRLVGWNKGEKHPLAKLTATSVTKIRVRLKNGDRVCDVARDYGVSGGTVSLIKHNKIWKEDSKWKEQHVLP